MSKPLPANLEAERLVLGSIMLNDALYTEASGKLQSDDFSLEKHRLIFKRMGDIWQRGESIDRVTVANELIRREELECCDGLSYLVSLDDGLPQILNLDSYIRIVKDKATLRRIIYASQNLAVEAMNGEAHPSELLQRASTQFLSLAEQQAESTLVSPAQIIQDFEGGINAYLDRKNRSTGLPSGFSGFDAYTGGFKPGTLYVLAARPAMGKTALALNIASHVAVERREVVLIFSLEMDKESLLDRMICARALVDSKRFEAGYIRADERPKLTRALAELCEDDRILIDDQAITNIQEIHAKIRRVQAKRKVGLGVIDYLQLLISDDKPELRVAQTSAISRGLKVVAKDTKIPLLALAQLSRACEQRGKAPEDKRPVLSDLRESGSIEADADVVSFLFRGEVYDPGSPVYKGVADLTIAKQRGGPVGRIPLVWTPEYTLFRDRAMQEENN
jgi:replicative DNA helicase